MKRYFAAGIAAAKANLVPAIILQAMMVGSLIAYWTIPAARTALEHLADLRVQIGIWYAITAGAIAGGVFPEVLRVIFFQRGRITAENWVNLAFGMVFWASMGAAVDIFYRLQGMWFGDAADLWVVVKKVFVDMLGFTPLIGVPAATIAYTWRHAGFRLGALHPMFSLSFYRTHVLPVLFPNWAVWGPVVTVIYSLPPGLQIPMYAFAQAFWALVLMTLTRRQQDAV